MQTHAQMVNTVTLNAKLPAFTTNACGAGRKSGDSGPSDRRARSTHCHWCRGDRHADPRGGWLR